MSIIILVTPSEANGPADYSEETKAEGEGDPLTDPVSYTVLVQSIDLYVSAVYTVGCD